MPENRFFLFDIDGTLLRSGAAGQAAMEEALLLSFGCDHCDYEIPTAGRTDRAIISDLFSWHQLELTEERYLTFRDCYLSVLPGHLQKKSGRILPGVVELLDRLSLLTTRQVGLLTGNFEAGGWLKLKQYDIDHHFHFGGFGDRHANRDDVARLAMQSLRNFHQSSAPEPEQVWVIGDTPADVQCARAVGAKVMAVATGRYTFDELAATNPDALFNDLSETEAVLQAFAS